MNKKSPGISGQVFHTGDKHFGTGGYESDDARGNVVFLPRPRRGLRGNCFSSGLSVCVSVCVCVCVSGQYFGLS